MHVTSLDELDPPPRITPPSPEIFERDYVEPGKPVIITGIVDRWRAFANWSPEELGRRFGHTRAPVGQTHEGMTKHSAKTGIPLDEMNMRDALVRVQTPGNDAGYIMAPVEGDLGPLLDDVTVPEYCREKPYLRSRLWVSPRDTATPLHRDFPENLFAQIRGRKRFVLFPAEDAHRLYAHPIGSRLPNFSPVDAEHLDVEHFPRLIHARRKIVIINPGELLYLPSRWWHQVRSLEASISINFWWARGPFRWLMAATDAYKRWRGVA